MRIVHYMPQIDFRMGGPPRAVVDQVATMHARGHEVVLATTDTRDVPPDWRDSPDLPGVLEIGPLSRPFLRLGAASRAAIVPHLASAGIVHLHGVWELSTLQVAAWCRKVGTPYVISLRGMLDDWSMAQRGLKKRIYHALIGRRYLEGAARVHCTAEAELAQSRKWFPRGHGAVVPNLMDLAPFDPPPDPAIAVERWPVLATAAPRLLFLSRVHYKKGIEHLVEAISLLGDDAGGTHVIVAGSGDEEYLASMRRLAEARGVSDRFTWAGHVSGDAKWSLYAASDVFVLPTSQENFGFVFFESLAAGTPVITTDLVDTREELDASGGGVIVPQTGEAFAEAIRSFIDGRRDAAVMGSAGRRWTFENLPTEHVAAGFERLYEEARLDRSR